MGTRTRMQGAWAVGLCLLGIAPARGEVTRVEITAREPYAGGRVFPGVGAYERLRGRVHFAVDPKSAANRIVVDLEHAPRNAQAKVEFAADLDLLAPVERARANGTLLYDVNNRGGMTAPGMFNGGADEFLCRRGFVLAASGWIAELLPTAGRLRLDAPPARGRRGPITGLVRMEMAPDASAARLNVAQWANHGAYAPTARGLATATLTARRREKDPRRPLSRDRWRLEVTPSTGEPGRVVLPRVELVALEADLFQAGHLYELIYEAQDPIVQGLGLAGIRDLVSFLKHDRSEANPLRQPDGRPAVVRAIGFGTSQSGRCLRQFLYDGFNADEAGRRVFEGLFPHVAGAGRGFFNHRFASPTRHNTQHDNHEYPVDEFPFTYGEETDPYTRRTDGILRRAQRSGTAPKVVHTQTSAEYWHRSGSLVHTDPLGTRDAVLPPEVRLYAIGGAQHGAGNGIPGAAGRGRLPANPTDYRPLLRALLTALDTWIRDGTPPPPSVYPRIADGTLAGWRTSESGWQPLPGVAYPEVIQQPDCLDHGPDYDRYRRLTQLPPLSHGAYRVLVPAYDADNNERGMLQLPTVAVPRGTFTGWNLRAPGIGAETELLSLAGGYVPFARTRAERDAAGDPRRSLEERYPDEATYLARLRLATDRLIARRLLLRERD